MPSPRRSRGTRRARSRDRDALFGEDAYAHGLVEQAERLGIAEQIEFRGFREDIWAELAELDILVHCSVVPEPFGQVVLEGMAAGIPVIAADAGGPAELITNGVDGHPDAGRRRSRAGGGARRLAGDRPCARASDGRAST